MSISTLESPASIRALDAITRAGDQYSAAENAAREDIARSFALLRTTPAKNIALPTVKASGAGLRERSVSMEYALRDLTMCGYAMKQLLIVLQDSECPLVQAYRDALCHEWQRQNASDVAEARS